MGRIRMKTSNEIPHYKLLWDPNCSLQSMSVPFFARPSPLKRELNAPKRRKRRAWARAGWAPRDDVLVVEDVGEVGVDSHPLAEVWALNVRIDDVVRVGLRSAHIG